MEEAADEAGAEAVDMVEEDVETGSIRLGLTVPSSH